MLGLIALCHRYGTPQYVAGGGGNVSLKDAETLWIKASGLSLAQVNESNIVAVHRQALQRLYTGLVSESTEGRETIAKQIMSDASECAEGNRRPSVETPMHDLFSAAYVVHTHPALVNGLACSRDGEMACLELFPKALWVPYTDPGVTLCLYISELFHEYMNKWNREPSVLIMQNHGLVVASDELAEIDQIHARIFRVLRDEYAKKGIDAEIPGRIFEDALIPDLLNRMGIDSTEYQVLSCTGLRPPPGPLTPDHIVYSGVEPHDGSIQNDVADFRDEFNSDPKLVSHDKHVYGLGKTAGEARLALELAADGEQVLKLTRAFGGPKFMSEPQWRFVVNWEAEAYRQTVARQLACS